MAAEAAALSKRPFFTLITGQAGLTDQRGIRVAWGDYNNDGWEDLLLNGKRLFKNLGHGQFTNVTAQAQITSQVLVTNWADYDGDGILEGRLIFQAPCGGVWADFDNDGHLDFVAIKSQVGTCSLWRNNGDGTFSDVTKAMGFDSEKNQPTQGAAWGDFDRDGFVDLYLANYERHDLELGVGYPDVFWKNEKGKRFVDATRQAGLVVPKARCGRGVAWADYNNDGLLDLYVSNYRLHPNFLWKNTGNGTFVNVAHTTGCEGDERPGVFGHTIGSAWGDFNNDGYLDLICGQLAHPQFREKYGHPMTMLYQNSGPPDWKFTNVNPNGKAGIKYEETHSNVAVADFDNDGFLDFYITSVYEGCPSFLYRNRGDMTFEDVTEAAGVRVFSAMGCAWADIDNDGDLDLVVGRWASEPIRLFRNELSKNGNHWLKVKLLGADCNRAAIGARVTVKAGAATYLREIEGGTGTTCQNSLTAHFGLGKHDSEVEVVIRWPCGKTQRLTAKPDQLLTLEEQRGR